MTRRISPPPCSAVPYAFRSLQAGDCPPGYYCPEGTGYKYTHPCPIGFYRKASAAISVQDCSVCYSGHYCDVPGLPLPKICPEVKRVSHDVCARANEFAHARACVRVRACTCLFMRAPVSACALFYAGLLAE